MTLHRSLVLATPWRGVYGTLVESGRHYPRHSHATYGMGFIEDGAHRSASGRGRVDAYAGDVITVNPGEIHDGQPLGRPSRRWRMLYLDPAAMAAACECAFEIADPVIRDAKLRRTLQRLFARLESWRIGRRPEDVACLACEESLVETCLLLRTRHMGVSTSRAVPADVTQVHDRLADDLLHPPTLSELAAIAGLSKYQVLRRFVKVYGLPPHAWLLQRRAERARRLIENGASLADAAASAGFADQSHLSRVFVRLFGFTPGVWKTAAVRAALQ